MLNFSEIYPYILCFRPYFDLDIFNVFRSAQHYLIKPGNTPDSVKYDSYYTTLSPDELF